MADPSALFALLHQLPEGDGNLLGGGNPCDPVQGRHQRPAHQGAACQLHSSA